MSIPAHTLTRKQLLYALPKHVLYALISGAIGGVLLYWLKNIHVSGAWELCVLIPMGAICANAAVLPLAVPGRHWSFAFICSMATVLMLVAGFILSRRFYVEHSNTLTVESIIIGGCLGLFYGLLSGHLTAMVTGLAMGIATGNILGLLSLHVVTQGGGHLFISGPPLNNEWIYDSPLHFAWQGALLLGMLHIGACFGAVLGSKAK